jgi:hypothetical protein
MNAPTKLCEAHYPLHVYGLVFQRATVGCGHNFFDGCTCGAGLATYMQVITDAAP